MQGLSPLFSSEANVYSGSEARCEWARRSHKRGGVLARAGKSGSHPRGSTFFAAGWLPGSVPCMTQAPPTVAHKRAHGTDTNQPAKQTNQANKQTNKHTNTPASAPPSQGHALHPHSIILPSPIPHSPRSFPSPHFFSSAPAPCNPSLPSFSLSPVLLASPIVCPISISIS